MRAFLAFPITVLAATGLAGCAETEAPASQAAQPGVDKGAYELTEKVECLVPGEGRQTLIYSTCITHNGRVVGDEGAADTGEPDFPTKLSEDAKIRFHVPGLYWRRRDEGDTASNRYEVLTLRGEQDRYPQAQVLYSELFPGYVYPRKLDLETTIREWPYIEDTVLKFSEEKEQVNRLGRVAYRKFSTTAASCFAFQSYFGVETGGDNNWGVPMESLIGYYCDRRPIDDALIEAALKTLDVRRGRGTERFSRDTLPDHLKQSVAELRRWIEENEVEFERRLNAFWQLRRTSANWVRARVVYLEITGKRGENFLLNMELKETAKGAGGLTAMETFSVHFDESGIRFVNVL